MLSSEQQKNYDFFTEHLPEYLNDPILKGKFAVICEESLVGVYDTFESAYENSCSTLPLGDFVIQQVVDSSEIVEFLWSAVM